MTNIPKIAFVLPSFAGGGAQRALVNLAAGLDRSKYSPFFVVFEASGPWRSHLPSDIPVVALNRSTLRSALPALIYVMRRERPNVIVSTLAYVNSGLLLAKPAMRAGTRLIVREANSTRYHSSSALGRAAYWLSYRLLYPRADRIVSPAAFLVDELSERRKLPRELISLVPNPIDAAALRQLATPPLRKSGAGRRFVSVGRLIEQKGYDRLLADFAQLPADSFLTIFGEGEKRSDLQDQIDRLNLVGRVVLPGFDPEPMAWIGGADALLLPSRWEGLPNVALEALACGTPVIATPEAGDIVNIRRQALPGTVMLAESGAPFVAAMLKVEATLNERLRPSLLPDIYRPERVAAAFADVLACSLGEDAAMAQENPICPA